MTRYSRKKGQKAPNRSIGKRCLKTKHYKKDTDQILEEIEKGLKLPEQKRPFEMIDELPGSGEYFCTECDRFFIDESVLVKHKKSKQHKQRVKELKIPAYSHQESEQAGGMGSYQKPKTSSSMTTTTSKTTMEIDK